MLILSGKKRLFFFNVPTDNSRKKTRASAIPAPIVSGSHDKCTRECTLLPRLNVIVTRAIKLCTSQTPLLVTRDLTRDNKHVEHSLMSTVKVV